MDLNPIVLAIPIYFLLIGIELVIQVFSKKNLYRLNDSITNISCGLTQQISGLFLKLLSLAAYQFVFQYLSLWEMPQVWWSYLILFVAVDFCYYWAHRMSHEVNLFWGGHVVHHQSEDYNFSVALRQGSFQELWTFMFYLPLAVVGFDTLTFFLVSGMVTIYQFWIHTETIGKLGPLEWVFNTPSHHRVHHGRDPKYIDKNNAGVFIVWDRLFGTFQEEEEKPTYGITNPTNSWNPLWVNLKHYHSMWQEGRQIPGLKNKVRYLFNKPGWLPEEMGGYRPPQEVAKNQYQKFDRKPANKHLSLYILSQYVLMLVFSAVFLFNEGYFSLLEKGLYGTIILVSVINIGLLLEGVQWIRISEALRVLSIGYLGLLYFSVPFLGLGLIAYALFSAFGYFYFLPKFKSQKVVQKSLNY